MRRYAAFCILMCCGAAASAQRGPDPVFSAPPCIALQMTEAPEGKPDWPFIAGSAGYLAGAAGGVALSFALVPADSLRGDRIPLRVAAGIAGGTLTSATTVYIANGFRRNLPLMIGGALAGQVIGVGVAGVFVLLDVAVGGILGSNEPGLSWLGMAVVLGTPFYASLGADHAFDLSGSP